MSFKTSTYNLYFKINCKYIVFNTLSSHLAEIDRFIEKHLKTNSLTKIHKDDLNDLLDGGFIIPESINEFELYINIFNKKKIESLLSVKLLLATSCNCSCVYCYQSLGNYKNELIGDKEIDAFGAWICNEIEKNKIHEVNIELFGGEPLLAKRKIPKLFENLNDIKEKYSIQFSTSIITNASLLNDDLIKIFINNNVLMKITIDGVGNAHNMRRRFKASKKNGYEIIMNNIKKIIELGGVDLIDIRMNVDKLNIYEVEAVAKELHNLNINNFYCGRVLFRGKKTNYDKNLIEDFDFDKEIDLKLYYIFKKYGFANIPFNIDLKYSCQFHNKHGYVISPSLKVAKCDELMDLPEYQIGYIDEIGRLIYTNDNYFKQSSVSPSDYYECQNCKLLPICGSGCPIYSLNTKGNLYRNYCSVTEDSVKLRISNILKILEEQ